MTENEPAGADGAQELFDEVAYVDRIFTDVSQEDQVFRQQEFSRCTFERCRFARSVFEECRFDACTFKECDLSVLKAPNSAFLGVRFEACKMIGIDWTLVNSRFFRIDLDKCMLNHSTFARMDMARASLTGCVAHDCDFLETNLARAVCRGTDFAKSRFAGTNLSEADFRGAVRYAIDPTANRVKQAKFSLPEATSLLAGFGIVIQ